MSCLWSGAAINVVHEFLKEPHDCCAVFSSLARAFSIPAFAGANLKALSGTFGVVHRDSTPMNAEYDETIAWIDALISKSEARIANQRSRLEQLKSTGDPAEDAQRALNLMLEALETARQMRIRYVMLMKERLP